MPPSISEEERKRRYGADLGDRRQVTNAEPVKHYLDHERGTIDDLLEGENWFNMLFGVFKESLEELSGTSGHTGVCFDVDGPHIAVKNTSERTQLSLARDNGTAFEPVPCLQMRILRSGDKVQIHYPDGFMMQSDIILEYRQTGKADAAA